MNRFDAADIALELGSRLRPVVEVIRRTDGELADQIYRAAKSLALNVAEGGRRAGKDRSYHFRIAAGSADEILAAVRFAVAWNAYRAQPEVVALLDRQLAMLWKLTQSAQNRR